MCASIVTIQLFSTKKSTSLRLTIIMFTCPNCGIAQFQTLKKLLRHIRLSHADQESFSIQCSFEGCKRTFRNLRTFENHIYGFHNVNTSTAHETEENVLPGEFSDVDTDDEDDTEDAQDEEEQGNVIRDNISAFTQVQTNNYYFMHYTPRFNMH